MIKYLESISTSISHLELQICDIWPVRERPRAQHDQADPDEQDGDVEEEEGPLEAAFATIGVLFLNFAKALHLCITFQLSLS